MKYLIVDIEADSLDTNTANITVICSKDLNENECRVWTNVDEFITYANSFEYLVFHNGIRFDNKVLKRFGLKTKIRDTLIDSKIAFPKEILIGIDKKLGLPLTCSYSLRSWGDRFKFPKGEVDNYAVLTDELIEYCKRDVLITERLFLACNKRTFLLPDYKILYIEYLVQYLMSMQEEFGTYFDKQEALNLYTEMFKEKLSLEATLANEFPSEIVDKGLHKFKRKILYVKNRPYPKEILGDYHSIEEKVFNPSSRQQVANALIKYKGFTPTSFTEKGTPNITEDVLEANGFNNIARYMKLTKDLGQLFIGSNSLIKLVNDKTNRLHGYVDFLSCSTHRASHSRPNITQVPKTPEFRGLFKAPKGKKLIGIDADALELMMLGYWLEKFGNTDYLKSVAIGSKDNGDDVHTRTQQLIGLPSRDKAKTFTYATIYGAGDLKIGISCYDDSIKVPYTDEVFRKHKLKVLRNTTRVDNQVYFKSDKNTLVRYDDKFIIQSIYGELLKNKFMNGTKGLKELMDSLALNIKQNKTISSLDGRNIYIDVEHKSLNYLCQSSGAIFMKYYLVDTFNNLAKNKLKLNRDYAYVANIHDALVIEAEDNKDLLELVCNELESSFKRTSDYFGFSYQVKGKANVGNNFYEIF